MAQQPMYQQIAEKLRTRIEKGELAPGAQLPTELELRDEYSSSRNTIRDAIKRLTSQGLVETRPGQGTFVTPRIDPFVTTLTGEPWKRRRREGRVPVRGQQEPPRAERHPTQGRDPDTVRRSHTPRLRVPPDTQVVSRHESRHIDGIPWSLQTSFYPMDFIPKGATRLLMAEDIEQGAVSYLAETIGVKQVGYRDWITARVPNVNEQSFFGLAYDATVFEIFRTGFDQTGTPLRVTVMVWPADRNQFIVNVGEVPDLEYEVDNSSADQDMQ